MAGLCLLAVFACGGPDPESIALTPGAVFSRSLAGQEPYRFRFAAGAGQFLRLDVEQRGVDVLATLEKDPKDPKDQPLYEIDTPTGNGTAETMVVVTPVSGRYLLTVTPLTPEVKGNFALKVQEVRSAGMKDKLCAAAAREFARAETGRLGNDFERVAATYHYALLHLDECGEPGWRAWAEWHLGKALFKTGQLRQAATMLESAAARFHRLGDSLHEGRALNDLGEVWSTLGDPERALAAYQGALRLSHAAGDAHDEAAAINNIGLVFKSTGNLQGAIVQFEKALDLFQRLGMKSSEAATRENLGTSTP